MTKCIDPNELMLGNWIINNHNQQPFQVYENTFADIESTYANFQPIILELKHLESAGFKWEEIQTHTDGGTKKMLCKDFILMDYHAHNKRFLCCPYGYPIGVERTIYVHQFQNVFYSLTGKKLDIKL